MPRSRFTVSCTVYDPKVALDSRTRIRSRGRETLGVIFALGPKLDMACTQELRLGDVGNGAAPLPIVKQASAKLCLAETTAVKRLHLGAEFLTGVRERIVEAFQWRVRQGTGERCIEAS
jgi:hypothetical protein